MTDETKNTAFAEPFTSTQRADIRGMSLYWLEVSRRENRAILHDELAQAVRMFGVLKVLQCIAATAAREESDTGVTHE
jgi:hypothetical protein